ncbi:hypothetical protein L208DRAFT_1251008 [Tricholoma matsutake]|nr:hypothetical protein L208DRAFT_1251008 [Tricholoma matsutake 945]
MKLNYSRKQHNYKTQSSPENITHPIGGGQSHVFSANMIMPYLSAAELELDYSKTAFHFVDHVDNTGLILYPVQKGFVHIKMALTELVPNVTATMTCQMAKIHKIKLGSHVSKAQQVLHFEHHDCIACNLFTSVFAPVLTAKAKDQQHHQTKQAAVQHAQLDMLNSGLLDDSTDCEDTCSFPPSPLSDKLSHTVVSGFCAEASPAVLEEAGCAVCGCLTPGGKLSSLKAIKNQLHVLEAEGVTRME